MHALAPEALAFHSAIGALTRLLSTYITVLIYQPGPLWGLAGGYNGHIIPHKGAMEKFMNQGSEKKEISARSEKPFIQIERVLNGERKDRTRLWQQQHLGPQRDGTPSFVYPSFPLFRSGVEGKSPGENEMRRKDLPERIASDSSQHFYRPLLHVS